MRIILVGLFLVGVTVMTMMGCARIEEPWDSTAYFKQERTRSEAQEKALRERAMQGETDRETGIQQLNRT